MFLVGICVFEMESLCDYYVLRELPHHSSDVVFHGESISDRFTSV